MSNYIIDMYRPKKVIIIYPGSSGYLPYPIDRSVPGPFHQAYINLYKKN